MSVSHTVSLSNRRGLTRGIRDSAPAKARPPDDRGLMDRHVSHGQVAPGAAACAALRGLSSGTSGSAPAEGTYQT
jgi:hypothetical protein